MSFRFFCFLATTADRIESVLMYSCGREKSPATFVQRGNESFWVRVTMCNLPHLTPRHLPWALHIKPEITFMGN